VEAQQRRGRGRCGVERGGEVVGCGGVVAQTQLQQAARGQGVHEGSGAAAVASGVDGLGSVRAAAGQAHPGLDAGPWC
jgi:hypothetical protein